MHDHVKITDLLGLLEPIGLEKPESQHLFMSINACIETLISKNHDSWNTKDNAKNITLKIVSDCFPGLAESVQVKAKKPTVKTIMKGIQEIVTQTMNEYKSEPIKPTVQPPSVQKAPATPARRKSTVSTSEQLMRLLMTSVTPRRTAMGESDNEDGDGNDDEAWAVDNHARMPQRKYTVSTQPTPVEHERPKSKTPPKKTHKPRSQTGVYTPMQPIAMPTAIDKGAMEKLALIRENEARREELEEARREELEEARRAQEALERQALLDALPKVAVAATRATQSEKKKTHQATHAPKTSPVKRSIQPKGERKLGPLAQKIDFTDIQARVLRPRVLKTTQVEAGMIQMAQQKALETVEQPQFSTSPSFTPDTPLSPVQASPTENLHNPQRSPSAHHTLHPVSSPLLFSEFFSSADSTPETRSAKKQKIAALTTPTSQAVASPFAVPSPRTPTTGHMPNNHVSPAVVIVPPAEILAQMEGTPVIQRLDVIEQHQQSPLLSPVVRQPNFLAVDASPVLRFSPVNRRRSSRLHTPDAVQVDVQAVFAMEPDALVEPAERNASPILRFSPVRPRQSPQRQQTPENAAVVSPVAPPRVASPRVPTPTRSPAQAPSPRRVSGVKRESVEFTAQQPVVDSYQKKRKKYK